MSFLRFRTWPIHLQVLAGPTLLLAVLLVLIGAVISTRDDQEETEALVRRTYENHERATRLSDTVARMETDLEAFARSGSEEFRARYLGAATEADALLAGLTSRLLDAGQRQRIDQIGRDIAAWRSTSSPDALARTGGAADAIRQSGAAAEAIQRGLRAFLARQDELLAERTRASDDAGRAVSAVLWAAGLSAVAAFAVVLLAAYRIVQPVRALAAAAARVGAGEMEARVPVAGRNELAQTGEAFNGMVNALAGAQAQLAARNATLHQREQELARIIETIADGVVIFDREGRFAMVNAAGERILRLRRSDLADTPYQAPPWTRLTLGGRPFPDEEYPFVRVRATGEPVYDVQFVIEHADGERTALSVNAAPLLDAAGAFNGMVASFTDITERRRTEELLNRMKAVVECSEDAIISTDLEGRIVTWNTAAERLYGYSVAEAIGLSIAVLVPADHADEGRRIIGRILAGESPEPYETVRRRKGGDLIDVSVSTFPIMEAGRRVLGIATIARDIAERKRADERLRQTLAELERQFEAAERYRGQVRAVLDAASEVMVLVSPDRRFLTVNRLFADFFGVDADEIMGKRFDEVQEEVGRVFADPAGFAARVAGTASDEVQTFTEIVLQKWPLPRELELFSTPVHAGDGAFLGRLYVFRDVTREREVDRMKTEFVSLVSHELRTPLTSIKGYVDLLLEGEVGPLAAEQVEFLNIVQSNTARLLSLINDLLDVSRIEAGKVELAREPVDISRLIAQVTEMLRPQIDEKGQGLTVDLPAEPLPAVFADPDRAAQILTNLLSNACKYTPRGGAIRIAARANGGAVQVDVADTGVGLTPQEQAQLFTKFFRARNRATQEAGGTGLGLAITRSLVQLHGGEIAVTSIPGQGSTFSFTLPTTDAVAAVRPRATLPAPGGRILIVDDEPEIAALLRRYLQRAGYAVSVAHTGQEALRLARSQKPDLITLDVLLPDADGFTVLEWLRDDPETSTIPVVMISILADERRGALLGAVDYLTKPVNEQTLLDRVGTVLSAGPDRTVLVVDDDTDVRGLIATLLRRAGYRVLTAADGAEAVRVARAQRPGLVLMDIRMPVMDGVAALRALREAAETREMPVVMMTASAGALEDSRSAVEALGGAALLAKPVTVEELVAAIGGNLPAESTP